MSTIQFEMRIIGTYKETWDFTSRYLDICFLRPFVFSYCYWCWCLLRHRKGKSIFAKSRKLRSQNLTLGQSTTKINCPEFQNVRLLHLKYIWLLILTKSFFLQHIFHWWNVAVVFFSQNILSTQNKFISKDCLFMPIT